MLRLAALLGGRVTDVLVGDTGLCGADNPEPLRVRALSHGRQGPLSPRLPPLVHSPARCLEGTGQMVPGGLPSASLGTCGPRQRPHCSSGRLRFLQVPARRGGYINVRVGNDFDPICLKTMKYTENHSTEKDS